MKRCAGCGQEMTRPHDHNCGYVTVTKDELRTLRELADVPVKVLNTTAEAA